MILQVVFAVIAGKLKGYRVGHALTRKSFIPFYVIELVHIFFQLNAIFGNYAFVRYAPILKSASLYSLLIPVLVYKLYIPALAGSGFIVLGSILNELVKHANGGKMPVFPTLSRLTGYFNEEAIASSSLHVLGNSETKLKFLCDYIDIGYSVLSIGDLLIHFFTFIIFFFVMKTVTKQNDGGTKLVNNS